ncbi:MAG: hypothetical protein ACERLG_07565 [Sedimentibacter sp.]
MAKRRSNMYGKKRKINYGRIILLVALLILLIFIGLNIFRRNDYTSKIEEVLNSEIVGIAGTISNISGVDTNVYSNNGISYTNQNDGIKKINSFDVTFPSDLQKTNTVKLLLEKLAEVQEYELVSNLPKKENGYYWLDVNFLVEDNLLIFKNSDDYNFDLYYDIEDEKIYVKEKYYDEFSKKNNNLKLKGYKADEELKNLILELAND